MSKKKRKIYRKRMKEGKHFLWREIKRVKKKKEYRERIKERRPFLWERDGEYESRE